MLPSAEEMHAILILGQKMRTAQKAYFKDRLQSRLAESKKLEKEFDARVSALVASEGLPLDAPYRPAR